MITWLIGENTFEIRESLRAIEANFAGQAERIDAADLTLAGLPDILMGVSLFATERLIIIRDITTNGPLFEKLPEWLPRVSETIQLVFVDAKPDKRTSSYKALKAAANVKEFPAWTERDTQRAGQWAAARAQLLGININTPLVRHLVDRVGVDQWQLANALEVLSLAGEVTSSTIDALIPANPQENIFQLFETALEGKRQQVVQQLRTLALQQDAYALFALLSSQAMSLAAMTFSEGDDSPTKEFGIHPFVASKMSRHAQKLGKARVARILEVFAKTDADLKRSKGEPWLLLERTLLQIHA